MSYFIKHKILTIVFILITIIWACEFFYLPVKTYFYFKNGQIVETEHYKVTLPFPKWIFYGESYIGYIVSADKDNIAEIAIDYRNIEIASLLKQCAEVQQSNKSYQYISGTEYLCKTGIYNTLYFLSDDGFFFLRAFPYEANKKNLALYKALFDAVQKK
jgi:hypothetical protein